ncbi:MAG: hypothetical protein GC153_00500 [Alphaproteobacteria bacterium]|nr:hypothetical protein [Alphaproteobacteria bacterium]
MNIKLIAGVLGVGLALAAAPAFAGEWRANRAGCTTEIVSRGGDRFDRDRYDRGRAGRSQTERITVCSRTTFVYQPDRRELRRVRAAYAYRAPALKLSYDGRLHMYYRYDRGVRLYIRG